MRSYGEVCAVCGRTAWLAARQFAGCWCSWWVHQQHADVRFFRSRLLALLTLFGCTTVSHRLIGQSSAESIQIVGITRERTNVVIEWSGGFPPYRLRVNKGVDAKWEELPNLIMGNTFTAASSGTASLFQIRTEFEPLRLTRISGNGELVYLDWQGGVPPYKVQACDAVDKPWVEVPRVILENYFAGFTSGSYKLYRVRTEPDTNAPSAPGNLVFEAGRCERILLSWSSGSDTSPGSGLKGHNLYRDGLLVRQVSAPDSFVLDTGLSPGHSYAYAVSSLDRAGNESPRSAILTVATSQCPVSTTNGMGSSPGVTLRWDPSEESSVAGYVVHWGREPGSSIWQTDVMRATSATITGLESGEGYFFSVTAYDVDGAESESSHRVACIAP